MEKQECKQEDKQKMRRSLSKRGIMRLVRTVAKGQPLRVNIRISRIVARRLIMRLAKKVGKRLTVNRRVIMRLARRGAKGYPTRPIKSIRTRIRWVIRRLTTRRGSPPPFLNV